MAVKSVIVINGSGGVGKDTLCDIASNHYRVFNVSSITPIKEIAAQCGWGGEKTNSARYFLSELKRIVTEYNDYPLKWLRARHAEFMAGEDEIMFVHIREPQEIEKFRTRVCPSAVTLLVRGGARMGNAGGYGNASDDLVENYSYDYYYVNDKALIDIEDDFVPFLNTIVSDSVKE